MIALVEDGDIITLDAEQNLINVKLSEDEIRERKEKWKQPPLKFERGILYKYTRTVASASQGCVTDEF